MPARATILDDAGAAATAVAVQAAKGRPSHRPSTLDPSAGLVYTPPALRARTCPTSPATSRQPPGHPVSSAYPCPVTGSGRRMPGPKQRPVGGDPRLAEVRVGENETFESALRRFNKKIQQSGILAEARRREHYEKPSVKRKRKEAKRKKATRQD